MKVLVVGSGGREHALVWKIAQSPLVQKIWAAPGNVGMENLAECVAIKDSDIEGLVKFVKQNKVDLTVVGPEAPLVAGIVDRFQEEKLLIFGPRREAALLEGSKAFSKQCMERFKVPTASFRIFSDAVSANKYILNNEPPFVVKASGLAGGKGVVICQTTKEAAHAVKQMAQEKIFGAAGDTLVIEQFLQGDEISVLAFTDGTEVIPLASSQDHKRVFDHDEGPNTGGMGAYSPYTLVNQTELENIVDKTIRPMVTGLRKEGIHYTGLIYAGIMLTDKGPSVLEYNVRFGDPETQAVLPRLQSDIVPVFLEVAQGQLKTKTLNWDSRACITVVLASNGYPAAYKTGFTISGLGEIHDPDIMVFHAGTAKSKSGEIVTNGGRVLAVSSLGATLQDAQEKAYQAISKIQFEGRHFRHDIGKRPSLLLRRAVR